MARTPQIAVLVAGLGSRLGRPLPKALTRLDDGHSILERQWMSLHRQWPGAVVILVVGFKMEQIMESHPDALFVYNQDYDDTNTAKSLVKALRVTGSDGVLWLNGDVVFHPDALAVAAAVVDEDRSFCCVNTAQVGDEEVKYTVDDESYIRELSKTVEDGLGEAIGINYVSTRDKAALIRHLDACDKQDYFERGIERAIQEDGQRWLPVDISGVEVVEVDFAADLDRANEIVSHR